MVKSAKKTAVERLEEHLQRPRLRSPKFVIKNGVMLIRGKHRLVWRDTKKSDKK